MWHTRIEAMSLTPSIKDPIEKLLQRELEGLYRIAKRMTGNDADAEDVVGQAILAAIKSYDRFDGRHPKAWLARIVRNEWLQVVRRRKSRGEVELEAAPEPSEEGFWRQVDEKLESERILEALDLLPSDFKEAIVLCDVEQMSYEEAAEAMGVPSGTLRSRLHRGRRMLRARLVAMSESGNEYEH
jgi:RNA polymerase sigma-70 factor (ECF subfamily)